MGADQYPPLVKSAISLLEELFGQIASVVGPEPTLPALFYTFFTFPLLQLRRSCGVECQRFVTWV